MSNFRRPKQWKKLRRVIGQSQYRRAKNRRFLGEGLENRVLLAADVVAPFQNASDPVDVNHDGLHSVNDALNVVSSLRQSGPRSLVIPLASHGSVAEGEGEGERGMSIDVNGDNFLTINDALEVVQRLRAEAEDDIETTEEDVAVFLDVLENDTYDDNTPLTDDAVIIAISDPTDTTSGMVQGSLIPEREGPGLNPPVVALTYAPPQNYSGQVSFTYTWQDQVRNETGSATVTVNVTEVNDDPTALTDNFTEPNGNPIFQGETVILNVLGNDSTAPDDPALEELTLVSVTQPDAGATVSITADNQVELVVDPNYFNFNSASFDTFTYTISDGRPFDDDRDGTSVGIVRFEVLPTEQAVQVRLEAVDPLTQQPITGPIEVGTEFDLQYFAQDIRDPSFARSGISQVAIDVLFNNSDSSAEQRISVAAADPEQNPHGFDIDLEFTEEFEGFLAEPGIELNKLDSFSGVWTDFLSLTAPPLGPQEFLIATIGLRADEAGTVNIVPDFPDGANSETTVTEPGSIAVFNSGGSTTLADGTTPIINFIGDSITIVDPITAVDDLEAAVVTEDSAAVVIDVTSNDQATMGEVTLDSVTQSDNGGTVSIASDEEVSYRPAANFNGTDTFTYTITDNRNNTATGTVTVIVTPVNDPPVANNDVSSVAEDSNVDIDVLDNDNTGPDTGETLEVIETFGFDNGGSATVNLDGTINYVPAADFFGTETFSYRVSDGNTAQNDGTATATVTVTVTNENDDPIATADSFDVVEDTPTTLQVLDNDSVGVDAGASPADVLVIDSVDDSSIESGASVSFTDTTITYTPAANFNGTDSFTYTIIDGNGGSATAMVDINVTAVNDAPTAEDDLGLSVRAGQTLDIMALDNDSDIENDTLTILDGFTSQHGATITTDGTTISYTPLTTPFNVTDTFTYTISDGNATDTATISVEILPPSFPIARDDSDTTAEETTVDIEVLTNDFLSTEGPTNIDLSNSSPDQGGMVTLNGNLISYTPALNFVGTETFEYQLVETMDHDNDGSLTSTATVTVTVTPVDDPPVAVDDEISTNEDTLITFDVTANDSDVDADGLEVVGVTQAANGSVSFDGVNVTYTPGDDFNGLDSFDYMVSDGISTDTATVSVTVFAVNDAPVLTLGGNQAVNEDSAMQTVSGFASFSTGPVDEDGQELMLDVQSTNSDLFDVAPAIDLASGDLTYTPAADAFGTATVTVTLSDDGGVARGGENTTTETFTITLNAVNDVPSFAGVDGNDQEVNEDAGAQSVSGFATAISAGPMNESGQMLTFNVNNDNTALFSVQPTIDPDTGELTYTPAADANGTATVTVTLSDDGGMANGGVDTSASQTFDIVINPVNDVPSFALGADITLDEDSGAQSRTNFATAISAGPANESDQELTFNVSNDNTTLFDVQPSIDPETGELTFTTALDANGSAEVTVSLSDDGGVALGGVDTSAEQTFTINVTPVNDAPVANDDSLTATEADPVLDDAGNTSTLLPLANDTDVDNDDLTITAVGSSTLGASIDISGDGTSIDYLPPVDTFNVTDTFTYTISDGQGGTDTATIDVFIEPLSLPRARNDFATVEEDSDGTAPANTINVLDNDRKNDAGTFTIEGFTQPANGTVSFNATNDQLVYVPNTDFQGVDTFTYQISDGVDDGDGVDTSTGTVTVTVNNVNDPPTANPDTETVQEDSDDNIIDALANDEFAPDPQETLTITNATTNMGGSVDFSSGTEILYTPAADFFGEETITYTISDGNGGSSSSTVVVTVENVNDDPTAVDDSFTGIVEDSQLADNLLNVLANDQITPDVNETLTITAVGSTSEGGTVSIDGGTALRYQPAADFFGTETFTYTIEDGNGGTAVGNVTVQVNNVNDDPTAVDDLFERILQTSSDNVLDVLANDTIEPDENETLTISGIAVNSSTTATAGPITTANGGTVSISGDGQTIIYTPSGTFEGNDTFSYTISDGNGGTATADVTVEVINFLTGSFSGFVYDDMNADGDYDAGERGYGSVEVHLTGTDFTGVAVDVTVESDASGRYEFAEIVPGDYEIQIDQPAFTLPGSYDSDSGTATVGTNPAGETVFDFSFDILDGTQAVQNNFRLAGFDPAQVNSVWDLLASSSGSQAIAIVNPNGSEGEFFTLREGWEDMQSFSVELIDADTVLIHVTDSAGDMHSFEVPAIRETAGGPYFRILAEDEASGMVAIRIIATPDQFGVS